MARNLLKEIYHIDDMSLAFCTSLDILLFQDVGWKKEEKIIQFEIGYGFFLNNCFIPSPWGSLSGKLINFD